MIWAQLSPGDLSQVHINLEGLENCTQCHSAGEQIAPENCLACHTLLQQRIASAQGLHAGDEFRNCIDCHSDHHGRDFQLIYWKEGLENFDHKKTGYQLLGAHMSLDCRQCHQEKNISEPEVLLAKKKDLSRTFLGLETACLSCHVDEHRGQLGNDCQKCHNNDKWQSAPNFDHSKAAFRLTGKHRDLDCNQCHISIKDQQVPDGQSYTKYKNIAFAGCYSCHNDVHAGRFGQNCQSCHSTSGWANVKNMAGFDHSKTRYPLEGKHRALACESCHQPGKPRRGLAFTDCMDCHSDYHKGQFISDNSRGACAECHTVEGFSPSSFTVVDHTQTDFPLEGGHLAVPCVACHQQDVVAAGNSRSIIKVHNFKFTALSCQTCHQDPHFGEVEKFVLAGGCEHCHQVESWRQIGFDHSQTEFALRNKHAEIACLDCHQPVSQAGKSRNISFSKNNYTCESCHKDPHDGQFRKSIAGESIAELATDCTRCHDDRNWQPSGFDHDRDSGFKLEAAHENVACEKCHPAVIEAEKKVMIFKPLDMQCQSCHG